MKRVVVDKRQRRINEPNDRFESVPNGNNVASPSIMTRRLQKSFEISNTRKSKCLLRMSMYVVDMY